MRPPDTDPYPTPYQHPAVRKPYGWDLGVPENAYPRPTPPSGKRSRRRALAIAAVMASVIGGLLVVRTVAGQSASAPSPAAQVAIATSPSPARTAPSTTRTASPTPVPVTPAPATAVPVTPIATPVPIVPATAVPGVPAQPVTASLTLTGQLTARGSGTTTMCANGAGGRNFCQWVITEPANAKLQVVVTSTPGSTISIQVSSSDGRQSYFSERTASGSVRTVLPSVPAKVLLTVTLIGQGSSSFSIALTTG